MCHSTWSHGDRCTSSGGTTLAKRCANIAWKVTVIEYSACSAVLPLSQSTQLWTDECENGKDVGSGHITAELPSSRANAHSMSGPTFPHQCSANQLPTGSALPTEHLWQESYIFFLISNPHIITCYEKHFPRSFVCRSGFRGRKGWRVINRISGRTEMLKDVKAQLLLCSKWPFCTSFFLSLQETAPLAVIQGCWAVLVQMHGANCWNRLPDLLPWYQEKLPEKCPNFCRHHFVFSVILKVILKWWK